MKRRRASEEAQKTEGTVSATETVAQSPIKKRSRADERCDDEVNARSITAAAGAVPGAPLRHVDMQADAAVRGELTTWHLSASRSKGRYQVLVFYPLDFTFVCPTELIGFSDRLHEFEAINCDVVGVSVDSKYVHLAWMRTPRSAGGLAPVNDEQRPFVLPLVSDLSHSLSKTFDVFDEESGHSRRAVVILSDQGIVRQVLINDDPVGRNVDEVLRLVKALQYSDAHAGEACPVNWHPGDATIKADPIGSKEFFNTDMDVANQQ